VDIGVVYTCPRRCRRGRSVVAGFAWYDSKWLNRYLAAKQILADVAPSKLDEFVKAFDVFRTDPAFM